MNFLQWSGNNLTEMLAFAPSVRYQRSWGSSSDGKGGIELYLRVWLEHEDREKQNIFENDVVCKASTGFVLVKISQYHSLTDAERQIHFAAYDHLHRGRSAGEKFRF